VHALAALPEDFTWLQARTGVALTPDVRGVKAVRPDGSVAGLVAYDLWTEGACQVHLAVETPAAWRCLLEPAFQYPFLEAGRRVLLGMAAASNRPLLRLLTRLGFTRTATIPDGIAPGDALHLFTLRREACRYLPGDLP
jgi:hypothetical protein